METSRSKRRRLVASSYASLRPRPDLPAIFESLNDDTLGLILVFVGNKSYKSFGGLNKHCKEVYLNTNGMTKETFLYGYAPLTVITDRYDITSNSARVALSKGVLFYNRRDVLDWALQEKDKLLLKVICNAAAEEERFDILDEVWNVVEKWDDRRFVFGDVDSNAARGGKLNVLVWFETKEFSIKKDRCAGLAAEKGLRLNGELYHYAAYGGHLHVMKWLREQEVDWIESTFRYAAKKGNLDILQWLHDEGCPWPDYIQVREDRVTPEVVEWLRANGYGNRIW